MIAFYAGGQFNEDRTVFEQESTQAMIALHRELPIVLIAMRGTETRDEQRWQDIWTDLDVRQVDFGSLGQVHRGFRQALRQVKYLVYGKLEEIAHKEGTNVELWITGHSLGGALATLLAARMVERIENGLNLELGGLYTYGSPRVGDYAFAESFTERAAALGASLMRFRHGNDAVTRIPIDTYFIFDFKHVGTPVYIDHDGSVSYDYDPWYGFSGSFSDHYMTEYFGKLYEASRDPAYKYYLRCQ
jgi:triacylglycerol lipase